MSALATTTETCHHGKPAESCPTCKANVAEYERLNNTAKAPKRGRYASYEVATRGTSNSNARGNTKQRAKRRLWILENWASDVPGFVRCYRCGIRLTESTMTIDRIVPGCQGGKYVPGNIRPCCSNCNSVTGATTRSDS